jgi:Flp pilus assembly protein TadB
MIDKKVVAEYLADKKIKAPPKEETIYEAVSSTQFKQFEAEILSRKVMHTIFEKMIYYASKIIRIKPDPRVEIELRRNLEYLWYHLEPDQVMGFGCVVMLLFFLATGILFTTGFVCFPVGIFFGLIGVAIFLGMPKYFDMLAERKRMKSVGEMPLIILYLVMYLRNNPVMDNAMVFAATNLRGPIAIDFRKLLWDVYNRRYFTVDDALTRYAQLWAKFHHPFVESIRLLQAASYEANFERKKTMYDQAVEIIFAGTAEKMKHYAQGLKLPMTVIHALGVMLPVMGLVMFPMVVMFLSELISSSTLFFVYNVLLAGIVFWFGNQTLSSRPETSTSISEELRHPDLPKKGYYRIKIGKKIMDIPVKPVALCIGFLIALPGLTYFLHPASPEHFQFKYLYQTLLIILGLGTGIHVYYTYTSKQWVKIRNEIRQLELELPEALFQIGNRLLSGVPIEVAIGEALHVIRGAKISEMFRRITNLMKSMNMTFEDALFHPTLGVMKYYPSVMITSVMKVIVASSRKGLKPVAYSMLSISEYLHKLHLLEEQIWDLLGDTASNMRFQATFLAPMISGVVVGLGVMIMNIIVGLHQKIAAISAGTGGSEIMGMDTAILSAATFLGIPTTSAEVFQLIVGIYMVEASCILSYLTAGIIAGHDWVERAKTIGGTLLFATIVYFICVVITAKGFSSMVTAGM